ncbi:hypothetical protein F3I62_15830 [Pseudomonas sp. R-28-1W-6]|uniref:hypothetical protein n=1 Tax=Pseudomonas sp. R-28-1W-6 TaxID=2650101 RepID=UPI00136664F0|nr:hypothetical protein [Pseudomonas sp. R-28-1W-6]MWV13572.1 hypothetical protein [Pseudomonas sp. R-28-1W-6]
MKDELSDFRTSIDNDEGLQSKRKLLVMACIIFLALNLTGATLEEANTFLFKIKFTNYVGLSYLFLAAIIFLTIRYYSYAQEHHSKLYNYWSQRLIDNYRILYYSHEDDDPKGLLGKAIDVYIRDEPGISKAKYCVSGIFKRSISYTSPGFDETGVQCYFTKYIPLTNFGEKWKLRHYLWLLWYELAYQSEATFKYRENLDLLAPYLLSTIAISSFIFKFEILNLLQHGT